MVAPHAPVLIAGGDVGRVTTALAIRRSPRCTRPAPSS